MATNNLNHSGYVALYQQIAGDIESDIAERRLGPFDKLPSEAEMRALYGVSRVTVRQAVELLVRRNLVFRKHGKGTFVSGPALVHELQELRGIYETIEATGLALNPPARVRQGSARSPAGLFRSSVSNQPQFRGVPEANIAGRLDKTIDDPLRPPIIAAT